MTYEDIPGGRRRQMEELKPTDGQMMGKQNREWQVKFPLYVLSSIHTDMNLHTDRRNWKSKQIALFVIQTCLRGRGNLIG